MVDTDQWLDHFQQVQRQIRFRPLYWLGIWMLLLGFLGLLWSLPVPRELLKISPVISWGSVFLMAALVYYFIISVPLAIGMLPAVLGIVVFETWLQAQAGMARPAAAALTVAGILGLYACHSEGGGLRAMRQDVQLLMIAPLWQLSLVYRRLGIPH